MKGSTTLEIKLLNTLIKMLIIKTNLGILSRFNLLSSRRFKCFTLTGFMEIIFRVHGQIESINVLIS